MFKRVIIELVKGYQKWRPGKGECRYYPSCSQYFIEVIEKYGVIKGSWRGLGRIARCNRWGKGGIDKP